MRLGAPVFEFTTPDQWVAAHREAGYGACYWPTESEGQEDAYLQAAREAGLVVAEVGAWSNPMSPDAVQRATAIENCKAKLALAERVGARCCVNITGSLGYRWDGPDARDLTDEAFDQIVVTTRQIIDAVKPSRTFYALETMPWAYPDSADSYLRLLAAIDRKSAGVHLDPVNLVNCPARYFRTDLLLRECFAKLGPRIRSCHAKDVLLAPKLTVHLDEVAPGLGKLDYATFLRELSRLDADTTLMIEHLQPQEYPPAAAHIRKVAQDCGLAFA
jgi:sugar phosphate isomerase/epimerase